MRAFGLILTFAIVGVVFFALAAIWHTEPKIVANTLVLATGGIAAGLLLLKGQEVFAAWLAGSFAAALACVLFRAGGEQFSWIDSLASAATSPFAGLYWAWCIRKSRPS